MLEVGGPEQASSEPTPPPPQDGLQQQRRRGLRVPEPQRAKKKPG